MKKRACLPLTAGVLLCCTMGPVCAAANLALQRPVSVSEESVWAASNAVDACYVTGKPIGEFFSLPTKHSWLSGVSTDFPKWLTIDLGKALEIDRVVVYGNPTFQPGETWIESSVDGTDYTRTGSSHTFARYEPGFGFCFRKPVTARFVKVCMNGSAWSANSNQVGLSEVEIYSDGIKSGPINLEIFEPFDGAVLNHNYDEVPSTGDIDIYVRGYAAGADRTSINGMPVKLNPDSTFEKLVTLKREKETVSVEASAGGNTVAETRTVFVDKYSYKRYWYDVDDVFHMVYDLHLHQDEYASVFDQPEFRFLKMLHDKYGTACVLMLFYVVGRGEDLPINFILTGVPDRFREEFQANSDWLKFSFHSRDSGSYPYAKATYKRAYGGFEPILKEVNRFAGPGCFSKIVVVHYGSGTLEAVRAWMDLGMRGYVAGMWTIDKPDLYLMPGTRKYDYMTSHDCFVDNDTGLVFIQEDMESVERVIFSGSTMNDYWDKWVAQMDPRSTEIMAFLAHDFKKSWGKEVGLRSEQGKQMSEQSAKWLTDHGYKPSMFYNYAADEPAFLVKFTPDIEVSRPELSADGENRVSVSVTLRNELGDIGTNYAENIHFTTTAGELIGMNPVAATNGVATVGLKTGTNAGIATVTVSGEWLWVGTTNILFEESVGKRR